MNKPRYKTEYATPWEPPKEAELQEFLKPAVLSDMGNPVLQQLAVDLAQGSKTPREASVKFWNFVVDNLKWYYEPPKPNMSVMRDRHANCMNRCNLQIALNRLVGIPARFAMLLYGTKFVDGYILPSRLLRQMPINAIVHIGMEVYLNGKWVLCDNWCERGFLPYDFQWNGVNDLLLIGPDFVYSRLGHSAEMPLEELNEQFKAGQITKKFCQEMIDPYTDYVRTLPREEKLKLFEYSVGKVYADNFARQLYLSSIPYDHTPAPDPKEPEPSKWLVQKKIVPSEVSKRYFLSI